ncbi:MAG: hypothetical protein MMC33_007093 [Icmadophila ericetorum]|nr:hypothetical protein [Icmadophila ericetorum]
MSFQGKILPALANNSLELTANLINFNLDFSLWKVESPKEFHGVGGALSVNRKKRAESGTPHMTARRIGALFEHILPETPKLFKVYGSRASEISRISSIDSRRRNDYGIFASHAGIDGTSLWAAATSGKGAIAIHLLACMLARMFDGPEATSVWMEFLEKRRAEIANNFEETNYAHIASLEATKQEISREQIRE